jgi:hypothetical protein
LGGRGDGERGGPDPVVEHLAEQHPDDGPPAHAEGEHIGVRGDQRELARDRAEGEVIAGSGGGAEADRHRAETDDHARGAGEQQRPAPDPVDQRDRNQRGHDVRDAGDHTGEQGVVLREPDRAPERRRVVEDHVDADELLEDREQDAHPDDRQQAQPRPAQVGQVHHLVATGEGAGDLADALVDVASDEPLEDRARLGHAVLLH